MAENKLLSIFNNNDKPLILDGATGSLIQQKGIVTDENLWTSYLNFRNPKIIQQIHEDYIKAGCDIITSNTFRTNPLSLKKSNQELDIKKAVKLSVDLSKDVAKRHNILLASSNAPAEDCYQKERTICHSDLIYNHEKHIELLYNNGSDFILNETQSHLDEIEIICKYCSLQKIPYIISLFVTDKLQILSGEKLTETIKIINEYNPLLISFNCISTEVFSKIINKIDLPNNWGFYLNCGSGEITDKNITCGVDEKQYVEIVKEVIKFNPKLIGACCGSNPKHIKAIKEFI